jgi:hypothetical protein
MPKVKREVGSMVCRLVLKMLVVHHDEQFDKCSVFNRSARMFSELFNLL